MKIKYPRFIGGDYTLGILDLPKKNLLIFLFTSVGSVLLWLLYLYSDNIDRDPYYGYSWFYHFARFLFSYESPPTWAGNIADQYELPVGVSILVGVIIAIVQFFKLRNLWKREKLLLALLKLIDRKLDINRKGEPLNSKNSDTSVEEDVQRLVESDLRKILYEKSADFNGARYEPKTFMSLVETIDWHLPDLTDRYGGLSNDDEEWETWVLRGILLSSQTHRSVVQSWRETLRINRLQDSYFSLKKARDLSRYSTTSDEDYYRNQISLKIDLLEQDYSNDISR